MKQAARTWVKNAVVAATLGLAAVATWAVTSDPQVPTIEAAAEAASQS